jgi:hypothetical protein
MLRGETAEIVIVRTGPEGNADAARTTGGAAERCHLLRYALVAILLLFAVPKAHGRLKRLMRLPP